MTFVLGGARSGKSSFAQRAGERFSRVLFLATATAGDEEMRVKIDRHRQDRPSAWTTVEEPLGVGRALREHGPGHEFAIVDCLTLFAANLLTFPNADSERELSDLLAALTSPPCPVVVVSNEVGSGIIPEYPLGRQFCDLLGRVNQQVAAAADEVVLMVAGLPMYLKRP